MLRSMTGYGSGKCERDGRKVTAEIRGVNHKYRDVSIKLPKNLLFYEELVRSITHGVVSRGKIDVFIGYEDTDTVGEDVCFNEAAGDKIHAMFWKMIEKYSLSRIVTVADFLHFRHVYAARVADDGDYLASNEFQKVLTEALDGAIVVFMKMRDDEGTVLEADMLSKIAQIEKLVCAVEGNAPFAAGEHKMKIEKRLKELSEGAIDDARLIAEIAVFADKCCIDEELIRLRSHIVQFRKFVKEPPPIGKKLDFLIQEIMRESNTICAKSNNLDITGSVIEIKAITEKIREQVQNIE